MIMRRLNETNDDGVRNRALCCVVWCELHGWAGETPWSWGLVLLYAFLLGLMHNFPLRLCGILNLPGWNRDYGSGHRSSIHARRRRSNRIIIERWACEYESVGIAVVIPVKIERMVTVGGLKKAIKSKKGKAHICLRRRMCWMPAYTGALAGDDGSVLNGKNACLSRNPGKETAVLCKRESAIALA
ncbi:uncharacterized protein EDB91DRAFT_1087690 [Suillus paluster]|uniref:uncharacterized protein n=1 Tax=Suillus paluster TaxID=48578 RepID=UPI001B8737E0|nr:uncharacterized protein EDB91DRAFT_1087690 [Suillus paluster]KAG1723767.1 hypothetical protein EDB91DRAFT_1087690 [Suillus paluster]